MEKRSSSDVCVLNVFGIFCQEVRGTSLDL